MKRVFIAGGAGFIGSHLARAHHQRGDRVIIADNLITGRLENIQDLLVNGVAFLRGDVRHVLAELAMLDMAEKGDVDLIYHLASLASPKAYRKHPVETLEAGSVITDRLLNFAHFTGARFVFASSSEVYGDPPLGQRLSEDYRGNVNTYGDRACYDESKRFGEAVCWAYRDRVSAGIARIFNTYGPGMNPDDGRLVPTIMGQLLRGEPLTIEGDGRQTRSLCYIDDMVRGLMALADSDVSGPVNLGSVEECTVLGLVELMMSISGRPADRLEQLPRAPDDPSRRCPDIKRARVLLDWKPQISLEDGLRRTWQARLEAGR